jgi:hypothetical protein
MFKLPSVRGFPAQSNTAAICEHVENSRKGKAHFAPEVDLAKLFNTRPFVRQSTIGTLQSAIPRIPHCTVSLGITEKKLFISTGRRRVRKKDGKLGSEEKIPVILVTVTATVSDGKREFCFQVTNRSTKVLDSRDHQRKPLADVRAELLRLCANPGMADAAADLLGEYLVEPHERKARPVAAGADCGEPPPPPRKPSRSAVRTMVKLIRDPVLEYLRKPITPLPDFIS